VPVKPKSLSLFFDRKVITRPISKQLKSKPCSVLRALGSKFFTRVTEISGEKGFYLIMGYHSEIIKTNRITEKIVEQIRDAITQGNL